MRLNNSPKWCRWDVSDRTQLFVVFKIIEFTGGDFDRDDPITVWSIVQFGTT